VTVSPHHPQTLRYAQGDMEELTFDTKPLRGEGGKILKRGAKPLLDTPVLVLSQSAGRSLFESNPRYQSLIS
jgi:hypothetical protein